MFVKATFVAHPFWIMFKDESVLGCGAVVSHIARRHIAGDFHVHSCSRDNRKCHMFVLPVQSVRNTGMSSKGCILLRDSSRLSKYIVIIFLLSLAYVLCSLFSL
jgi:hypothetical protein